MRAITLFGVNYKPGDDILKTSDLTPRRLLKLYEARKIAPKAFAGDVPKFFHNPEADRRAAEARAAAERELAEAEAADSETETGETQTDDASAATDGADAPPAGDAVGLYQQIAQQRETTTRPRPSRARAAS